MVRVSVRTLIPISTARLPAVVSAQVDPNRGRRSSCTCELLFSLVVVRTYVCVCVCVCVSVCVCVYDIVCCREENENHEALIEEMEEDARAARVEWLKERDRLGRNYSKDYL